MMMFAERTQSSDPLDLFYPTAKIRFERALERSPEILMHVAFEGSGNQIWVRVFDGETSRLTTLLTLDEAREFVKDPGFWNDPQPCFTLIDNRIYAALRPIQ